jgi:hypothetical protein
MTLQSENEKRNQHYHDYEVNSILTSGSNTGAAFNLE